MSYPKSPIALVCSAVLLAGASHAKADAVSDAWKAIQAAYDARDRAMAHKDVNGTLASVASDYVGTTPDGRTQTYAIRQQGLPEMFRFLKSMSVRTTIRQFTLQGNIAADRVESRNSMTILDPSTHLPKTAVFISSIQDVWTRQGGLWLLRRSQQLENKRIH